MDFPDVDLGETAKEVEAAERAWMEAWLHRDIETCNEILDEGFVLTSATGVLMGKAEWLEKATGAFSGLNLPGCPSLSEKSQQMLRWRM